MIASAKIAGLEVYQVIPYLFPAFVLSIVNRDLFFLRKVEGEMEYEE